MCRNVSPENGSQPCSAARILARRTFVALRFSDFQISANAEMPAARPASSFPKAQGSQRRAGAAHPRVWIARVNAVPHRAERRSETSRCPPARID